MPFAALAAFLVSRSGRKMFVDELTRLEDITKLVYMLHKTWLTGGRLWLCFLFASQPFQEWQD